MIFIILFNLLCFIPLLLLIITFWKGIKQYMYFSLPHKILHYFVLFSIICNISCYVAGYILHNNLFVMSIYGLGEFALLSLYLLVQKPKRSIFLNILYLIIASLNIYDLFRLDFNYFSSSVSYITTVNHLVLLSLLFGTYLKYYEERNSPNPFFNYLIINFIVNALVNLPLDMLFMENIYVMMIFDVIQLAVNCFLYVYIYREYALLSKPSIPHTALISTPIK